MRWEQMILKLQNS